MGTSAVTPMRLEPTAARLEEWIATQLPDARSVRVEGLDRVEFGHSAETLLFSVLWADVDGASRRDDVVARIRPPDPGLLPPYDLKRQFEILRALERTAVRAPRTRWFESSGHVLGREFYVMERLDGSVYERDVPEEIATDPERIGHMCDNMIEQIAAIHMVDLDATGLRSVGDGPNHLRRELDHWASEIRRVQRGPLPALERLVEALRDQQPDQCSTVTLVHGDAKAGNFAFEGNEVVAVFDWEMATTGDPLTDIGWAEMLWDLSGFTALPGARSREEFVNRWQELTGITAANRPWYRGLQLMKMATIQLVGSRLFDDEWTDDQRFVDMAYAIGFITERALGELGITEQLDTGPVLPRIERIQAARNRTKE
jgi:aminoglycoside phosphotransferase (APT) family kinase protein